MSRYRSKQTARSGSYSKYVVTRHRKQRGYRFYLSLMTVYSFWLITAWSLKIEIYSRFHLRISSQVERNCTQRLVIYIGCEQTSKTADKTLLLGLQTPMSATLPP